MIKLKLAIFILLTTVWSCKTTESKIVSKQAFVIDDIAKVKVVNGTEVYIMNSPLREYEVVQEIETSAKFKNILKDGQVAKNMSEKIIQFISKARKLEIPFDAVLYTSGKTIVCIKFKGEKTSKNSGFAKVEKTGNLYAFVMCSPSQPYDAIGETNEGLKLKSLVTLGMVSNSIATDVDKMVDELKNNKGIEACVFDGSKGYAIKFLKP